MKIPTDLQTEEVDEDDDIYTLEEFRENVNCGGFIDDDGYGDWSDGKVKLRGWNNKVHPSSFGEDLRDHPWATHVVWYNK